MNVQKLGQNMTAKMIVMLLMISLPAHANPIETITIDVDVLRSYDPHDCIPSMGCLCFPKPATKRIANEIKSHAECRAELSMANDLIETYRTDRTPVIEWWQQPAFVIGGITVGVSLGLLAGVLVGK